MLGDIPTPDMIFCNDPPNRNFSELLIWENVFHEPNFIPNPPNVTNMNTLFKVSLNKLDN